MILEESEEAVAVAIAEVGIVEAVERLGEDPSDGVIGRDLAGDVDRGLLAGDVDGHRAAAVVAVAELEDLVEEARDPRRQALWIEAIRGGVTGEVVRDRAAVAPALGEAREREAQRDHSRWRY
jgi:hypothetical protein